MTPQQMFDTVVTHLRTQNARATLIDGGSSCCYRAPDGKKCAFGCLITDEEYTPDMEGRSAGQVINYFKLERYSHLQTLANDLQSVHDCTGLVNWETDFERVANRYNLVYTPPVTK